VGMMFIDRTSKNPTSYPLKFEVYYSESGKKHLLSDVQEWVDQHNMECFVTPVTAYFLKEEDAAFFMLRWA
jgi:hypothetical protein